MDKYNKIDSKNNENKFMTFSRLLTKKQGDKLLKLVKESRVDQSKNKKYLID